MSEVRVAGIRGATTVDADEPALIKDATLELLEEVLRQNGVATGDIISAIFTVTSDLSSEFPARAARELGWRDIPLLCAVENGSAQAAVAREASEGTAAGDQEPGAAARRCIRVLLHVTTRRSQVRNISLRGAVPSSPITHHSSPIT